MYRLLSQGFFGNTINQFFSIREWKGSPDYHQSEFWGVRSLIAGGPCRLFCPREEVEITVQQFQEQKVNISAMIDTQVDVTLWADVYDSPTGLLVYGIEYPPKGGSWRKLMPVQGKQHTGIEATLLLRKHLNAYSLDDLYTLRDIFPGHVYELSACSRNIGRIPNRNAVMWEVRAY